MWRGYGLVATLVLVVLFTVGAVGHAIPVVLPMMLFVTPVFLLLTGVLVVVPLLVTGGWRCALWLMGAYVFTFFTEVVGVATGVIFGEYTYGKTLGWAWLGVPLIIAFNWVMVVNGAVLLAKYGRNSCRQTAAVALLAGGLAAAFDFVMEPVAVRLDYWTWANGVIPLQNYGAWFVIGALVAFFHPWRLRSLGDIGPAGRLAVVYVVMQAVFFGVLRLLWLFE